MPAKLVWQSVSHSYLDFFLNRNLWL